MAELIIGATMWISGLCVGFAWGCGKGLTDPAWALGFVHGFTAPWRWIAQQAKGE